MEAAVHEHVRLDDGRIRMFASGNFRLADGTMVDGGLFSFISEDDGISFAMEEGVRLTREEAGIDGIGKFRVAQVGGGVFRAYFDEFAAVGEEKPRWGVRSAWSPDLLEWTMDEGVRIGEGASFLTDNAQESWPLERADGGVTLFYKKEATAEEGQGTRLYHSTSTDGLSFTHEYPLGVEGSGPFGIQLTDGSYLLYYDAHSEGEGAHIRVGRLALAEGTVAAVDEEDRFTPGAFSLKASYPNPFNANTTIRYGLPQHSQVTVIIYDLVGRKLAVLVKEEKPAGRYEVTWDAGGFASGVYFYRIEAGDFVQTKKFTLLK